MTDHLDDYVDFDARLRTLLAVKAGDVEPMLSGPEVRRLAGERTSGMRRVAAAVSAAAAVIIVAVATQHLGEPRAPQRGPAGHTPPTPATSAPLLRAPRPTPVHSPRPSPTTSGLPRDSSTPAVSVPHPSDTLSTVGSSTGPTSPSMSSGAPSSPAGR